MKLSSIPNWENHFLMALALCMETLSFWKRKLPFLEPQNSRGHKYDLCWCIEIWVNAPLKHSITWHERALRCGHIIFLSSVRLIETPLHPVWKLDYSSVMQQHFSRRLAHYRLQTTRLWIVASLCTLFTFITCCIRRVNTIKAQALYRFRLAVFIRLIFGMNWNADYKPGFITQASILDLTDALVAEWESIWAASRDVLVYW